MRIVRDGGIAREVYRSRDIPGALHGTLDDCSANGCGWPVGFSLDIPRDWVSGTYLVHFLASDRGRDLVYDHLFVLKPEPAGKRPAMLFLCATGTWVSYNNWGGSNAYEGITGPGRDRYSPTLSWHRPWARGFCRLPAGAPRSVNPGLPVGAAIRYPHMEWAYANGFSKKYASAGWASYDSHFARWAENQGYDFDYATLHDLHHDPGLLEGYRCLVLVGHDEYWSWEMRDAVDKWVEQGGRVARFAGNFMWQIRIEGNNQVCYKYRAPNEDPVYGTDRQSRASHFWETPEVNRPGASTFGINALEGVYASFGGCVPRGPGGFTVYRPEHWAFQNSDLYYGDVLGMESRIFGYEVDGLKYIVRDGLPYPADDSGAPEDLEILALGLATRLEADHGHYGSDLFIADEDALFIAETLGIEPGTPEFERLGRGSGMVVNFPKGRGEVFTAATCDWVMGLARRDAQVEQVTRNVIDRYCQEN